METEKKAGYIPRKRNYKRKLQELNEQSAQPTIPAVWQGAMLFATAQRIIETLFVKGSRLTLTEQRQLTETLEKLLQNFKQIETLKNLL